MANLQYETIINAPRERVYKVMLEKGTYEEWTRAFTEGFSSEPSSYEGDWNEGSDIRFVSKNPETGKSTGMMARVKANVPNEFVSVEHYGEVWEDAEKFWSKTGFENYAFADEGGDQVDHRPPKRTG